MSKYASLVTVEQNYQNVQELASIWGDIRNELETHETTLESTYAILGEYDFLLIIDAEDRDAAYRASLCIERYGLDMQTMEILPMEDFAGLVEDL
ncbi:MULTISPECIES: GYD domain-containing protein [unclassified Haladaptatus]|uniref:GYD domain-containing protein n=1 Tax=unclassified Haladaptatus TaxID=2622732 RepID=UPI00209BF0E0|nr:MULTISPECIES: GYD domain-containing protein [unclassified Haladaptatus]MCO8244510.1 GYD domain-containing protein [Haladaptatus sp. AB643]MCO8253868.1 GYD domain-containing protein [Haladaptatus sp. AB618]